MGAKPVDVLRFLGRSGRRIGISIVGAILLLAGLAMMVLPGPGMLVIVLGFAVLATEYAWAARALERSKQAASAAGGTAKKGLSRAKRSIFRR